MKKAYSVVMSLVLVMGLVSFSTGCTSNQFNNTIATISAEIPTAITLAEDIETLVGTSSGDAVWAKITSLTSNDLPLFQQAVNTYIANKTAGTKAAIFATFNTVKNDVNATVLAANGITNPASQKSALDKLAALGIVVNAIALLLAPFFNGVAAAKAEWQQMAPYFNRRDVVQEAERLGYSESDLVVYGL